MAERTAGSHQVPLLNLGYVNDQLSQSKNTTQHEVTPMTTNHGSDTYGSPSPLDVQEIPSDCQSPSRTKEGNYQYAPIAANTKSSKSFISSIFPSIQIRRRTEIVIVAVFTAIIALIVVLAATLTTRAGSPSSTGVTISSTYGQYQGRELPSGVTEFLGVRYASMPKRFSAPTAPPKFSGIHIADTYGPVCQGSGNVTKSSAEDCLFADIWAPTGAINTSKYPVYVFTQGGGLTNAVGRFNGTKLLNAANNSIVFVSFSYRVGPFGFLASEEVRSGGDLNVGYLDQYQLLKFVQSEIAMFGGDPNHVTLGGQSAGAGSVVSQLLAYGGKDQGLFHSALMQSSSMPTIRNVTDQRFQYERIVSKAGCSTSTDTLSCLRTKSQQEILEAAANPLPYPGNSGAAVFQWAPVIDDSFIRDIPVAAITRGEFIKVPTIFGDDTDEGTIFTPRSITTESSSRRFIQNNYPTISASQLDNISRIYNFSTPSIPNNLSETDLNSTYWQRAAQAYGEMRYNCPGQHMANLMILADSSMTNKIWHWRYNLKTARQIRTGDGTSHGSELAALFGPPASIPPPNPEPAPGATSGVVPSAAGGTSGSELSAMLNSPEGRRVIDDMQSYWISFVRDYNPNTHKRDVSARWENWNREKRILFELQATKMETVSEEEEGRCGYLAQIALDLRQ